MFTQIRNLQHTSATHTLSKQEIQNRKLMMGASPGHPSQAYFSQKLLTTPKKALITHTPSLAPSVACLHSHEQESLIIDQSESQAKSHLQLPRMQVDGQKLQDGAPRHPGKASLKHENRLRCHFANSSLDGCDPIHNS